MYQLGNDTEAFARFSSNGAPATGLTVNVVVYRAGVQIATGTATHIANGVYSYTLDGDDADVAGTYLFLFTPTTDTDELGWWVSIRIGLGGVEYLDVAVSSRLAASGGSSGLDEVVPGDFEPGTAGWIIGQINHQNITLVVPLARENHLTLWQGDSYLGSRAIPFPGNGSVGWPADLTDADHVDFIYIDTDDAAAEEVAIEMTIVDNNPVLSLTVDQTEALVAGKNQYTYRVRAFFPSDVIQTLLHGKITVNKRI